MYHYVMLKSCPLLWLVKFPTFRSLYKKWNIFWLDDYFDLNFSCFITIKFVFHLIPKTIIPDTVIYILSSGELKKVFFFCFFCSAYIWSRDLNKKNSNFFFHLIDNFIIKKLSLNFSNLTRRSWVRAIYVCIGKNRYFELRHIADFYFVWKGLNLCHHLG